MASAPRVWALRLAIGLLGAIATVAALLVAVTRIDFSAPSLAELAAACQRYALPDVRPASVFVLVLGSLSLASVVLMLRSLVRQLRAGRRFERGLELLGDVPGMSRAYVFDDHKPHAFCIGLLCPRVYVSRAALELLDDDEREAVLAHEAHHARRRDPLRLLVARALGEGLFFLPVVARLTQRYAALAELAADEAAAARLGVAGRSPRRCSPSTLTRTRRLSASPPNASTTCSVTVRAGSCRPCCCSARWRPSVPSWPSRCGWRRPPARRRSVCQCSSPRRAWWRCPQGRSSWALSDCSGDAGSCVAERGVALRASIDGRPRGWPAPGDRCAPRRRPREADLASARRSHARRRDRAGR